MSRRAIKAKHQGADAKPSFFPPRRRAKQRGRGRGSAAKDSPAVLVRVGREQSQAVLASLPEVSREQVEPVMTQTIAPGSTVYTDAAKVYRFLKEWGYQHETVNHSQGEYARGPVHENRAEAIWSLLKPWLATFRGVSQANLGSYLTFFQFLFNHRQQRAFERSELVLRALLVREAELFAQAHHWLREAIQSLPAHPTPI